MTLAIKAEIEFGNRGSFNPGCSSVPPWPNKLLTQVKMSMRMHASHY